MKEYLPYIVSILMAIITGITSYLAASKKSKTYLKALQESNTHEINRLMEQHKLDIDSLERKHQMEVEKMEMEHRHQLELKDKEMQNALGERFINGLMDVTLKTPEVKQAIGQAFREQRKK